MDLSRGLGDVYKRQAQRRSKHLAVGSLHSSILVLQLKTLVLIRPTTLLHSLL
jgi:hypothetical protein